MFSFAGLWSYRVNKESGEVIKSYTIITTEANTLMSEIHDSNKRMPVILTRDNETDWFNDHSIQDFVHPEVDLVTTKI